MGDIFVVFGPSGVGKSSVVAAVLANDTCARARQVVTCTTRTPRFGEVDGVHYHFVSSQQFCSFIDDGALVEWSQSYGNYYGVRVSDIEAVLLKGEIAVLLLDRNGVVSLKERYQSAQAIFLQPPSLQVLEERLRGRGTEQEYELARRLDLAWSELQAEQHAPLADYYVVNDDFNRAVKEIEQLVCL